MAVLPISYSVEESYVSIYKANALMYLYIASAAITICPYPKKDL